MDDDEFIALIYEQAFGDDAISKDYTHEDVLERIKDFAEKSWQYEELCK